MQSSLYVALSAQIALQDRLDTIAQNVANANSAGYRGTEVKFDSVLSDLSADPVAFVTSSSQITRLTPAEFNKTGNTLDVAVKGDGWLSVESPQGPVYTRDGRLQMNAAGGLVTMTGATVLDPGGHADTTQSRRRPAENCLGWNHKPGRQQSWHHWPVQPSKQRQAYPRGGRLHIQRSGGRRGGLHCERRRARLC